MAYPWEKAPESSGKKKIWKVQESPKLKVATSCGHSTLKNMKKCVRVRVCVCVYLCVGVHVCTCVGLC